NRPWIDHRNYRHRRVGRADPEPSQTRLSESGALNAVGAPLCLSRHAEIPYLRERVEMGPPLAVSHLENQPTAFHPGPDEDGYHGYHRHHPPYREAHAGEPHGKGLCVKSSILQTMHLL